MRRGSDAWHQRLTQRWFKDISSQIEKMVSQPGSSIDAQHKKRLTRKLLHISQLLGYHSAMQSVAQRFSKADVQRYLNQTQPRFWQLAKRYEQRKDMDKAAFSYVLSQYPPKVSGISTPDAVLLSFLRGSNTYCRDNTLRAFNAFGDAATVEQAFEILAEHGIFHHEILLAQDLMTFSGDKKALAVRLWKHADKWPAHMGAAVVQFIEMSSGDFREVFYEALVKKDISLHLQLAILQYFRSYPYEPMKALLINYIENAQHQTKLAIKAASVLVKYPGRDSINALISVLSSPNWFLRNSSAHTLVSMGLQECDWDEVHLLGDAYALEMISYHEQAREATSQIGMRCVW